MQKIRTELGEDAVILNSKEIETGGILGFFTKKQLEVIAAIDPVRVEPRRTPRAVKPKQITHHLNPEPGQTNQALLDEIQQLKKLIQGINEQSSKALQDYPEPFQSVDQMLFEQEVSEMIRLEIMKYLLNSWYNQERAITEKPTKDTLLQQARGYLKKELSPISVGGISYQKQFVNIVGPTGVGKTTTIAKLAAHSVLKKQKKVALITTDTYRIAAVEQLKTYAKILNIPLEVAYSIDDFKKAKELFQHYDLVLVDSAGRNFRNSLYVEELAKIIDFHTEAENYLVLSLTSKYRDMKAIIEQFSLIPLQRIVFTKKDETVSYGAVLNVMLEQGKGVAYLTNGQNVPDDIMEVDRDMIIELILGAENDE